MQGPGAGQHQGGSALRTATKTVRAGVIGIGAYATGIITQVPRIPDLEIPAISDADLSSARRAYQLAGVPDEDIVDCDGRHDILRAMERGKCAVTENPLALMDLPLDVIVESTGVPEAGALHALRAIEHGKHVAMVNKETDATVGPILNDLADRAGVVYCLADGDQPGLLIGLVRWAESLGIEVVSGGKALDDEFRYDPAGKAITTRYSGTIALQGDQVRLVEPTATGVDAALLEARRELLSPLIGKASNSDLVELVAAANATGLSPDIPGLHTPVVYTSEISRVLCEREDGGVLSGRGRFDAVACLRMQHEAGLGGGVFIVADGGNDYARRNLRKSPVRIDDHPVSLITRPHHLLGLETPTTILAAATGRITPGAHECLPRFDVAARAGRDLKEGEVFGHIRGKVYTQLEGLQGSIMNEDLVGFVTPARAASDGAPLPVHLLDGNRLAAGVPEGAVITHEMVVVPSDSVLWELRAEQDARFLSAGARG